MAIKRKLNSVTQKVGKRKIRHKRLSAAEKMKARKAYMMYKKRRNSRDKKFDLVRAKFRAGKRKGRPNKPGAKHGLFKKSTALRRKANALKRKLKTKGKLGKKDARTLKALTTGSKRIYSGNRKRMQMSAKDRAHEIVGQSIIRANKIIAAANKTGSPTKIAAAKAKAAAILTSSKNQAVRVIQDARRDLTGLRKLAGRNHGGRKRGRKPGAAGAGAAGIGINKITPKKGAGTAPPKSNKTPGGAPSASVIPMAPKNNRKSKVKAGRLGGLNAAIAKRKQFANNSMSGVGVSVKGYTKKATKTAKIRAGRLGGLNKLVARNKRRQAKYAKKAMSGSAVSI